MYQYDLASMTYLHRQNGVSSGNVGRWRIILGKDTSNGRLLSGTWSDDRQVKTVDFGTATVAQFLYLTPYSEAGDHGTWSNAAEMIISKAYTSSAPTVTSSLSGFRSISSSYSLNNKNDCGCDDSPSPTCGSACGPGQTSTHHGSNTPSSEIDNSSKHSDDKGLHTIQTVFTVLSSIAAVVALIWGFMKFCNWGRRSSEMCELIQTDGFFYVIVDTGIIAIVPANLT